MTCCADSVSYKDGAHLAQSLAGNGELYEFSVCFDCGRCAVVSRDDHRKRRKNEMQRVHEAAQYLIENPDETFDSVAFIYAIRKHQLRASINNRFGSLTMARLVEGVDQTARPQHYWNRPCMRCGDTDTRDRGQYLCDKCSVNADVYHDGAV